MGWGLGFDEKHQRDIGYSVPSHCDYPECRNVIDRGLSYVCGGEPYGGDTGCGLYFCSKHLGYESKGNKPAGKQRCERCLCGDDPFEPRPDHKTWTNWKLKHWSWWKWRAENGIPEPTRILRPDPIELDSRDYMVYLRECVGK